MTPSTLVPTITKPLFVPPSTEMVRLKHRVTLNLSVRDARAFRDYLDQGELGEWDSPRRAALSRVQQKLANQLSRCGCNATVNA